MSRQLFLAVAAATAFAVGLGATAVLGSVRQRHVGTAGIAWSVGNDAANFFHQAGDTTLNGNAVTATFQGTRITESGNDGNFEFEHPFSSLQTTFDAVTASGQPTPMEIGRAGGQNVTAGVVPGGNEQTVDNQSWQVGTALPTAINLYGRLRPNGIVLLPLVRGRKVRLYAILPNGTVPRLQPVGPPPS